MTIKRAYNLAEACPCETWMNEWMNEWMRMQMFNVQSKNRQEISLVYCMNQTKRLMEKTAKKTIAQSGVRKGSPMEGVGSMAGRI